jgi:choline dehydrogenase-like flavoprotein
MRWGLGAVQNIFRELIEADVVVLALGAIETPKLLLASRDMNDDKGIGVYSKHVGRHITAHPLIRVIGNKKNNKDELEQPLDFPTLASRHFDTQEFQGTGKLFFVHDSRSSVTKIEEELRQGKSVTHVRDSMRASIPFELRGFVEVFSDDRNYIELGSAMPPNGGNIKNFNFATRVHFTRTDITNQAIKWAQDELKTILSKAGTQDIEVKTRATIRADHATSTCRMSNEEDSGVVDSDLRVHGVDNLFICSNAVLPNGAAVNPTLTLIALTERLADHLAGLSR